MQEAGSWGVPVEFESWVKRSRTPEAEVDELRRCFAAASSAERQAFEITADFGFTIPIGLVVARAVRRRSATL